MHGPLLRALRRMLLTDRPHAGGCGVRRCQEHPGHWPDPGGAGDAGWFVWAAVSIVPGPASTGLTLMSVVSLYGPLETALALVLNLRIALSD